MGSDYSFYVKTIETHARAFLTLNILALGRVEIQKQSVIDKNLAFLPFLRKQKFYKHAVFGAHVELYLIPILSVLSFDCSFEKCIESRFGMLFPKLLFKPTARKKCFGDQ